MNRLRECVIALATLVVTQAAFADELIFNSGPDRVALLELYTSEGCSSCPPADRWLSSMVNNEGLWTNVVPVAFHVDYWDYIGWKDRFASPRFSERQRRYAREGGVNVVYTPGFILDGQELRGTGRVPDAASGTPAGQLQVTIRQPSTKVSYQPTAAATALQVNVAWLGFDLTSKVSAGENRDRELRHDFVVLQLDTATMTRSGDRWLATLPTRSENTEARRRAIAVWVSQDDRLMPLQATGGFLPDS